MKFPDHYTVLNKNFFENGSYQLVPIRYKDRLDIMKWRNEQIYHLRQNKPLTEEHQESNFRNVVAKLFEDEQPNQILFSYLQNGECIGYGGLVHLNWMDRNAEISFIMDTKLEKDFFSMHWSNFLNLLEQVAFEELNLHKIYTYAFDLRPQLYPALENAGFIKEATLLDHCLFQGKFKNVIIHSKVLRKIVLRSINQKDVNLIYQWSNDPVTRQNSFNSDPINYEDHIKWFQNKLKDENSTYYICEVNAIPAGLVRFDTSGDITTIGILIDENFRGKKLAQEFLQASCRKFRQKSDNQIFAFIKKENIASLKSFQKADFVLDSATKINNFHALKYVYSK